jgi:hypothetical protein
VTSDYEAAEAALRGLYTAVRYTDNSEQIRDAVTVHTTRVNDLYMSGLVANMQSLDHAATTLAETGQEVGPLSDAETDELIGKNRQLSRAER